MAKHDYRAIFEAAVKHHENVIDELLIEQGCAEHFGTPPNARYIAWLQDSLVVAATRVDSWLAILRKVDPAYAKRVDDEQRLYDSLTEEDFSDDVGGAA